MGMRVPRCSNECAAIDSAYTVQASQAWGGLVAAATHSGTSSLQIALLAAGVYDFSAGGDAMV